MNRFYLVIGVLGILISTSGCKKCYDCKKQIFIEVNGQEVPTDNYFEEDTCDNGRKKFLEDEGYSCDAEL